MRLSLFTMVVFGAICLTIEPIVIKCAAELLIGGLVILILGKR
jgi:hypothetical protein